MSGEPIENKDQPAIVADYGTLQDNINALDKQSGKIKGIVATRIDFDLKEDDIDELVRSVHVGLSKEASIELVKFIRYKINVGNDCENYKRVYRDMLGDELIQRLTDNQLTNDDRFTIMAAFVTRLLQKRPLVFYGENDSAIYRDGSNEAGSNDFVKLASDSTLLMNYISYSEQALSRRLTIAGLNHLYKFTGDSYQKLSTAPVLICAQSPFRFERKYTAEYKRLIISEQTNKKLFQNLTSSGVLKAIKKGGVGTTRKSELTKHDYLHIHEKPDVFLDITEYKHLTQELYFNYLAHCQSVAEKLNKKAYVRLHAIAQIDTNKIVGIEKTSTLHTSLTDLHASILFELINQQKIMANFPLISTIEISDQALKIRQDLASNESILFTDGSNEDKSAALIDPMANIDTPGSTNDLLLCINTSFSPNAFPGNRIYKNSLSNPEAETSNGSNITTIFNPMINPLLQLQALINNLTIVMPSGKLDTLTEIKEIMSKPKPATREAQTTEESAHIENSDTMPAKEDKISKPKARPSQKSKFKNFIQTMKSFFAVFWTVIKQVYRELKNMINAKIQASKQKKQLKKEEKMAPKATDASQDHDQPPENKGE